MTDINTIANILEKAKKGQFVSLRCNGSSESFLGHVVQLGTDKVYSVKAESWQQGWPETINPS